MRLGVLCSGGKDSIYSCGMAMEREDVACLITVHAENEESYLFHTPNIGLVRLQAEAAALPLVETVSAGNKEEELADLGRALDIARDRHGIAGVVTGAILSVYQASRIQRLCRDRSLWCFNPLWHTGQEAYLRALIGNGYDVLVSGVFSAPFDESWLGRRIDARALELLIHYAEKYRITLTGEGGEYETFVRDAPFFRKRIEVVRAETAYRNYRGIYRITDARLVDK
ncbi:MAG: diphthine--ammonia ligase [Methanomicrobiales archaeon]|nr:diphthine--ammonia ligase [Methanomicrobiales archaeon]NYT21852.1 diphthine--ammonia ligase [Methanomicrobiales archaeon]